MRSKGRIVVIDDEVNAATALETLLREDGYEVASAHDARAGLALLEQTEADVVLTDLRMPGMDGIELLARIKEMRPQTMVLLMTAYGTVKTAVRAMKMGAEDYLGKPIDVEELEVILQKVLEKKRLLEEARVLRERVQTKYRFDNLVGESPEMLAAFKTIQQVASSSSSVLLLGESGTGKELFAQALHQNSPRRSKPFVKVACAALPETLLESELFGHEKGSFTGALAQRKGRFEMAHKGTIFLDEIGDMTLSTQRKLLRVLQDKAFERVGGSTAVKVDCRIVAATNRNLKEEVDAGRFREDLYYRLNVVTIHVPPLRERKDDIPLLTEHFLVKFRYTPTSPPARISEEAMQTLVNYDWPGNVRQLEHTIERAVIMARGGIITSQHLALDETEELSFIDLNQRLQQGETLPEVLAEVERKMITRALDRTNNNRHAAARLLGIDIATLERGLAEHRLGGRAAVEDADGER